MKINPEIGGEPGLSWKKADVPVPGRCPYCGRILYEKLGRCEGEIRIKCTRCGRWLNMNLNLRTMPEKPRD